MRILRRPPSWRGLGAARPRVFSRPTLESSTAFLQKILTERPEKWLPPGYKSYEDVLVAAADRAVAKLTEDAKSSNIEDWPWRDFNSLEMLHPIGREGLLRRLLSI